MEDQDLLMVMSCAEGLLWDSASEVCRDHFPARLPDTAPLRQSPALFS